MGFALALLCASANAPLLGADAVKEVHRHKENEWEKMVKAICQVESGCDDKAKNNKSSAAGRFQMLKVYVDEVNRLCGRKAYNYSDRFNAKIRKAQQLKIPYMVILGEKEMNSSLLSIRERTGKQKNGLSYEEFAKALKEKIDSKEQL